MLYQTNQFDKQHLSIIPIYVQTIFCEYFIVLNVLSVVIIPSSDCWGNDPIPIYGENSLMAFEYPFWSFGMNSANSGFLFD